ncbi:SHD1 domain-containing protein [Anatilimnocola floriformis]|uniref:SHD1 domain-containing protein n=1 Tax=Anatilimnocola floriformis TaxID=2948575 RepID=UPI0020C223F9|nr:SHD1 domain-containing protein [Anatilimnocola floriformis]
MRRCQGCGQKFVLQATSSGCLQGISTLLTLVGIGIVTLFVCCGGIAYLSSGNAPQPRPSIAPHQEKSQVIVSASESKQPLDVAVSPKPPPPDIATETPQPTLSLANEPASAELYTSLDRNYGLPIASVVSTDVVAQLRATGFTGPEPTLHPNGLPDIPEARIIRTWHLSKMLPEHSVEVDVIGDDRGAMRRMELHITSLDGQPAKLVAKREIAAVTVTLARPRASKWLIDNVGQNRTDNFDGHKLESIANSDLALSFTIAGSPVRSAYDYHSPREWKDATGGFKVTASFVSLTNGVVKLRKEDGKVIEVPTERLSVIDQEFLNSLKH